MAKGITYVGMDVHKKSINVAMLLPRRKTAEQWKLDNTARARKKLVRKLKRSAPGEIRVCYEAGPTGFGLQRELEAATIICEVVAPSLIPRKPGERIKTDRRDAKKLAQLLRADLLTEVHPPTEEEEAVRDLCRCRDDARDDLVRSRHRLTKFLLRRNRIYGCGKSWTLAYGRWLKALKFDLKADRLIFADYLRAVEVCEERMKALDEHIAAISRQVPYAEPVARLRCFRGIDTTTAMVIVTELHQFGRFKTARALMAYLGLVPGEHSSGEKTKRGGITKTGNVHVRRTLVECAWHYRHRPRVGAGLRARRKGQPADVIGIADCAQSRLHRKYHRLVDKGKPTQKAVTAIARELIGFIWAVLYPHAAQATEA